MDSPAVNIASPRSNRPASPTSQQSPLVLSTTQESTTTTTPDAATEEDDLDPAAFLKSVRELSEKREREDNERYRKLEEEIEKGRQERLARREGELACHWREYDLHCMMREKV
jgi:flagellar motility protein MotE (MotC chaperone)